MSSIVIAVDAMGGDNAPIEPIKGAIDALINEKIKIVLVGKKNIIKDELNKYDYDKKRIEIVDASEVIEMSESPINAIKTKKDSSIVLGLKMLKEKKVDAFVSAGSTGALLTGATIIVGRIKGVERPVLGAVFPTEKSFSFALDVGANADCKATLLLQFAKLASVYVENVLNIKNPAVGLINIGLEDEKGSLMYKEANQLLRESNLNFIGNIEGNDIPCGKADILVCDGFVGNVILKFIKGYTNFLFRSIKVELSSSSRNKIGAVLSKGAYKNLKKRFDFSKIGGVPFLGVKSLVIKASGNSDAKSIKYAIFQSVTCVENEVIKKIEESI